MSRLIAFSADKQEGFKPVSFEPKETVGMLEFRGGDHFTIGKGVLLHHLPLHRQSDETGKPSARSVDTYRLSAIETGGWSLILTRSKGKLSPVKKAAR